MKGSITAFLSLSLALFLSAVFALLEAGRVSGLKMNARLCTMQAADGVLAEYEPGIWEDYQLLFRRTGTGNKLSVKALEDRQQDLIAGNFLPEGKKQNGLSFLSMTSWKVTVDSCELPCDHGGKPFILQAAAQTPLLFAGEAIRGLKNAAKQDADSPSEEQVQKMENHAEKSLTDLQSSYEETRKKQTEEKQRQREAEDAAMEAATEEEKEELLKKRKEQDEKESRDSIKKAAERKKLLNENPVTQMKKMKKTGILQLVMPGEEVSGKSVNPKELLSKRKRNTGTMPDQQKVKAQDKLLFRIYLNQKFRNAVSPGKDGALDYELEYLLGGKKSDEANLKSAVRQLLLIREGMNYLTLMKDAKRQAEAAELAIAISTAFLNPEFEEVVRQAILVAWAFQESVRDVKDLLADKKVPLVKTVDQWGRSVNKGLSYQHYLQMLLMLRKDSDLAYRAMDLIEKKEQVQMDTMVSRMDCTYEYQADGLFSGFVWIGSTGDGYYRFQETQSLSYLG